MKNASILLLEDDVTLHETLKEYLEEEDFEITGVFDGEDAEDLLYERTFDLLIEPSLSAVSPTVISPTRG